MKKKRIDLTGAEIMLICRNSNCRECKLMAENGDCLGHHDPNQFHTDWIMEEIEVVI